MKEIILGFLTLAWATRGLSLLQFNFVEIGRRSQFSGTKVVLRFLVFYALQWKPKERISARCAVPVSFGMPGVVTERHSLVALRTLSYDIFRRRDTFIVFDRKASSLACEDATGPCRGIFCYFPRCFDCCFTTAGH